METKFYYTDPNFLNELVSKLSNVSNQVSLRMHPNNPEFLRMLGAGWLPAKYLTKYQLQKAEGLGIRSRYALILKPESCAIEHNRGTNEDITMANVRSMNEGTREDFYRTFYPITQLADNKTWLYIAMDDFKDDYIPVVQDAVATFVDQGYTVTHLQAHFNSRIVEDELGYAWGGSDASFFASNGKIELFADKSFLEQFRKQKLSGQIPLLESIVSLESEIN